MNKKIKTVVPQSRWIPDELFQAIQKNMPVACVDLIVLRRRQKGMLETLLIKRKIYPEQRKWCLIGGRILKNEYTKDTIKRQAKEELGVSVKILPPWNETNPFAVFNDPISDKQKHFVALAYPVVITKGALNATGPEFSEARWFPLDKLPARIGFYHPKVLAMFSRAMKKGQQKPTVNLSQ
ncbi:MAG: DUF4916 domain-containing protein [Candidatus Sungbacteria bacterium]|nr:DUF4916 domain-containing protein [Candidatus Sungbacteria bacterium]